MNACGFGLALACGVLSAGPVAAQPMRRPSTMSCVDAAKTGIYRVNRASIVWATGDEQSVIKAGTAFDERTLEAIRRRAKELYAAKSEETAAARFDLNAVTIECKVDDKTLTANIDARVDRLLVLRGDTVGLLLDDAPLVRPNLLPKPFRVFGRVDHDQTAKDLIGFHVGLHDADGSSLMATIGMTGWKSVDRQFYRMSFDSVSSDWYDPDRGWHNGAHGHMWFENVPFGPAALNTKGLSEGFSTERQLGRVNARGNIGFRFDYGGLVGPGLPDKKVKELAFESSWHQELTTRGGFAQLNGWFDAARAFGIGSNFMRYGSTGRVWEDFFSTTIDVTMSVAGSDGAPDHRLFRAGARLDPFLGSPVAMPEDLSLAGPVVRGFGVAGVGLAVPNPIGLAGNVGATAFHGGSVTLSLPGLVHPLLRTKNQLMRDDVQAQMSEQFADTVMDNLSELIDKNRTGRSADQAIEIATREALELRRTLQDVINHGRRFSARPIIVGDWAHLRGASIGNAWSVGIGVRVAAPWWGGELLFLRNGWTTGIASSAPRGTVVVRFRMGKLAR